MPYLCGLWRFANAYCMKEREVYVAFLEKLEKLKVSW